MPTSSVNENHRQVLSPEERAAASASRVDTKARYEAALVECYVKINEMAEHIATDFARKKESVLMDIHGGVKEKKGRRPSSWKVFFKEFAKTANMGKAVGEKSRFEDLVQAAAKEYGTLSDSDKAVLLAAYEDSSNAIATASRVSGLSKIRDVQHTVASVSQKVSTHLQIFCV